MVYREAWTLFEGAADEAVPSDYRDGTSGFLLAFILWGQMGVGELGQIVENGESDIQRKNESSVNRRHFEAAERARKAQLLDTEGVPEFLPSPPATGSPAPEGATDLPPQPFNGTSLPAGSWEPKSFRESPQMQYQRCIQLDEYEG
jgi:hypothetical protein